MDNPLTFWQKDEDVQYYQLYKLQRLSRWIYVQKASESSVEQLFSLGGYYFSTKKNFNVLDKNTDAVFKVYGHRSPKYKSLH